MVRLLSPATTFGRLGNYKSKDLWRSAKENRDMAANITAEWNARGIDVVIGPGSKADIDCREMRRIFLNTMYRVFHQLLDMGWVDLDLRCSTIMPSCSAISSGIPPF